MAQLVIPWQCWDTPGFKQCHAQQWNEVSALCKEKYTGDDLSRCIEHETILRAFERCVPFCPEMMQQLLPPAQKPFLGSLTTNQKIMGAAALTGIVVWLFTRKRK